MKAQVIVTSCQRRSLELQQVRAFLRANGYEVVEDDWIVDPDADLLLLSTCGFTQEAEDFGFEALRRIQEQKKPSATVVFGGCIPEINPDRVANEFEGSTFSPKTYSKLNEAINATVLFDDVKRPNTLPRQPDLGLRASASKTLDILKTFDGSVGSLGSIAQRIGAGVLRKVAPQASGPSTETFFIQIQQGCSMRCTYCSIRHAIGKLQSRPLDAIMDEFRSGLEQGFRRFHLLGDNASSYGLDIGTNMGVLLTHIEELKGDFALELTDINPVYLSSLYEPLKKLCSQGVLSRLYVPIQSANMRILRLMKRTCDIERVKEMLLELKAVSPSKFKLGTSIIVGFPSETPEELEDTIAFCREVGFDWVWCHNYSSRPETVAAEAEQIPESEIAARSRLVKIQLKDRSAVMTADDGGDRYVNGRARY